MKLRSQITLALVASASLLSSPLLSVSAAPAKAAKPKPKAAVPAAAKAGPANAGNNAAFNNYANQMRQKMGAKWDYPSGNNHVTLTVTVAQDGGVNDFSLTSNPKNTEAEQKANDAFNSAQPLQPLPTGVSSAKLTINFNSQADQWDSKADIAVRIDPLQSQAPAGNTAGDSSPSSEPSTSSGSDSSTESK